MSLTDNSLTGSIPSLFNPFNQLHLVSLELGSNFLSSAPVSLGRLRALTYVLGVFSAHESCALLHRLLSSKSAF